MSTNRDKKPEEDEKKIPVFTVIKNGAILKNIFVMNKPPPLELDLIANVENVENPDGEAEEILIVGRHPDCNIVLMHPSISRFHLQINSKLSARKLFVTDLSSVHGTWVSEKKIEPGFRVELNEGDTIRVGGSTRVYRLHWVPLSSAYDTENTFVSTSDVAMIEEKEDENAEKLSQNEYLLVTENEQVQKKAKETYQGGNEEIEGPFTNDNELNLKAAEGALQSPEYYSAKESLLEKGNTDVSMTVLGQESNVEFEVNSDSLSSDQKSEINSLSEMLKEIENQSLLREDSIPIKYVKLSLSEEDLSDTNHEQVNKENQTPLHLPDLDPSYEQENQENLAKNQTLNGLESPQIVCAKDPETTETFDELENSSPSRKDYAQSVFTTESVNSSLPFGEVLYEIVDSKQSQTPESAFPTIETRSEKKSSSCNIWSRRGKPATAPQLQTSTGRRRIRMVDVDPGVEWVNQEDVESKSITRALFSGAEAIDEQLFTPDKENHIPNTSVLKFSKKKGKIEDIQLSSPKITFSPVIRSGEDMIASSDKENQTPKFFQQRKSARLTSRNQIKLEGDNMPEQRRKERLPFQILLANSTGKSISEDSVPTAAARLGRIPFQSLFTNSPGKSISEASIPGGAARSSNSIKYTQKNSTSIESVGDGRGRWTMIADTTSLLDKESRKSLQLLQGLKGTHLIIPRMVIRALDSLNQRGRLFRRTTEASLVLKWLEECMVKTKWWIHVQSSLEDARPIAPTPPASPASQFSKGSSVSFSPHGSLFEIVSPTTEDHILECALSYRKMNSDGQLVLLSNEVTLKIKAMAEGLVCETAKEFRDSLVNPFSDRFLWADSSPRGQTWSVLDDIVLKEKYYRSPSKKSIKGEPAKGLKLILLHNSHYGQISRSIH
ncbi:hypothetical protein JCGZ_17162 [Jatropha curcas]|uniref:FHA domain-containing protein n=1 Tax=Jatropha curcas TaxID=180498 RepID=A0A067K2F6_JATCU|nr:FHA domain-containing protein PS1 isoform X2 [Jatropha curcas]KDP30292.1 hypothetical protein JCGZ_17162 [Jatropha curcas]